LGYHVVASGHTDRGLKGAFQETPAALMESDLTLGQVGGTFEQLGYNVKNLESLGQQSQQMGADSHIAGAPSASASCSYKGMCPPRYQQEAEEGAVVESLMHLEEEEPAVARSGAQPLTRAA